MNHKTSIVARISSPGHPERSRRKGEVSAGRRGISSLTLLSLLIALFLCSCQEEETPTGTNRIEMGSTTSSAVSYYTAQVTSNPSSIKGNKIIQHGHCWGTSANPTISDNKTSLGSLTEAKAFTSNIENLTPNTIYFVRSYFTTDYETIYGASTTFKTLKTGKPVVTTSEPTEFAVNSAKCGGTAVSDSGLVVTEYGLVWDTLQVFSYEKSFGKKQLGEGLGSFTHQLIDLKDGKTYHVKAYAKNDAGVGYGEVKVFNTVGITAPLVTTTAITLITTNSAQSGGNITADGNSPVITRGVVWSTTDNPTLEDNLGKTTDGSGTGNFTSQLNGLTEGTTYYVRAYSTNSKDTGYGDPIQFTTKSITAPLVTTAAVTFITTTTASGGGNVTSDGNATVTARGIVWNNIGNPTLESNQGKTTDGSSTGSFTSQLSGLTEGTTYYVRAYATNSKDTGYGSSITYLHKEPDSGTYIDSREGNKYNWKRIGTQVWMTENLKETKYTDGTAIPNVTDNNTWSGLTIGAYCWYNNDIGNKSTYGALYNWYTLNTTKLCPSGWHVPTDTEWKQLEKALGMTQAQADATGWRGTDQGTQMKTTSGWYYNNGNGTNTSGFSGLPGGIRHRNDGSFWDIPGFGYWWSSTEYSTESAWFRRLGADGSGVYRTYDTKGIGFSVRCVRDN